VPRSGEIATATNGYSFPLRFAWWGRVSTEDQQDPTLSLPRQLRNSRSALPAGSVIVAHYFDVESGRRDLELRGQGASHERFDIPIPRDGGIQDLLEHAKSRDRTFDAVICESIDRIARRTYLGTKIEHDLEGSGVALFASDEPIAVNGKRASAILTRRVKQGVAEWYVLELLEKSWDGFREHTKQGWNVGRPPYGYVADKVPHPVPARRAEGRTKSKLAPDPERALVVHQIFKWRVVDRLGYAEIAERLNSDLERCPPPVSPDPARCRDRWSRSSVHDLLANPKYTGYMVWIAGPPRRGAGSTHQKHGCGRKRRLMSQSSPVSCSMPLPTWQRPSSDPVMGLGRTPSTPTPREATFFGASSSASCAAIACTVRRVARPPTTPAIQVETKAEGPSVNTRITQSASGCGRSRFWKLFSGSFQNESLDRIAVTFWRPS
jgi:DNA invertase Pin-like site-specific DNA recombinase